MGELKKRIEQKQKNWKGFNHISFDDILNEAEKEFPQYNTRFNFYFDVKKWFDKWFGT